MHDAFKAHHEANREAAFVAYFADIRTALHQGSKTTQYIERLVREAFMAGFDSGAGTEDQYSEAA